jgi:hypothetical protein
MNKPSRYIVALLLAIVYSLIIMSPLAPLALKSPRLAHAVTGECSGNCEICGCSPERRANHTCCCFLKKKHQHDHENVPECCKYKKRHKMKMLTCDCPCGSKKQLGLWGAEKFEQLPYHFAAGIFGIYENTRFAILKSRLTDRCGDPPDPPPKLIFTA